jgi:hypothetical protein
MLRKVAANAVDDGAGTHIETRNGFTITYRTAGRTTDIGREIISLPDGGTGGSEIDLTVRLNWDDGSEVTLPEKQRIQSDLRDTARLLGTRFVIIL